MDPKLPRIDQPALETWDGSRPPRMRPTTPPRTRSTLGCEGDDFMITHPKLVSAWHRAGALLAKRVHVAGGGCRAPIDRIPFSLRKLAQLIVQPRAPLRQHERRVRRRLLRL